MPANDHLVAAAISLSVNASSFGAISRLYHASFVTLRSMLATPTATAVMPFADRFTSRAIYGRAFSRIVPLGSLLR